VILLFCCSFTFFFVVVVKVEVEIAVVKEEGAALRRGPSVLCPFGDEYCGVGASFGPILYQ
jgi:hypothetical protein